MDMPHAFTYVLLNVSDHDVRIPRSLLSTAVILTLALFGLRQVHSA